MRYLPICLMIGLLGLTGCVNTLTSPAKPYVGKPIRKAVWEFKGLTNEQLIDLQNCTTPYLINNETNREEDFSKVEVSSIWASMLAGGAAVVIGIKAFFAWLIPW